VQKSSTFDLRAEKIAYSVAEVSQLISVGRTTIYGAIKNGDLRTNKIGRRTLVTATSLQMWMDSLPTVKPFPALGGGK
jgi:excisionase family DNA binding protein